MRLQTEKIIKMKSLTKTLAWITTGLFGIAFFGVLCVFHVLQVISLKFGYHAHNRVINSMVWWLNIVIYTSGNRISFKDLAGKLPTDRPMIIISNHQSIYDIPVIVQVLKRHHPKFIAKKSLSKGIPSVSFNIRNGGSISIDRKNQRDAAKRIIKFCEYLKETNRAGCIFVEGRRSKDGQLLPFKKTGINIMLKKLPNAIVVPVAIENFWQLERYKFMPIPFGVHFKCTALPTIDRDVFDNNDAVIEEAERRIREVID